MRRRPVGRLWLSRSNCPSEQGMCELRTRGASQGKVSWEVRTRFAGLSKPYLAPLSEDDCSLVGEEDPVVIAIPTRPINNSEP